MPERRLRYEARPPGEARRPPRRTHPRSERSTQRVAPQPARTGGQGVPGPLRRATAPGAGLPASAAAGSARSGASGGGLRVRGTRYVKRSEHGCARLGGRRASPGGRASCGPAMRHGHHRLPSDGRGSAPAAWRCAPSEGAPPAGQARFARVLRAAGALVDALGATRLAVEHGRFAPAPRAAGARFTRRAASRLGCGAGSLRSRTAEHGPPPTGHRPPATGHRQPATPAEHVPDRSAPPPPPPGYFPSSIAREIPMRSSSGRSSRSMPSAYLRISYCASGLRRWDRKWITPCSDTVQ